MNRRAVYRIMSACLLVAITCPTTTRADSSTVHYGFIGEWEGTATAFRPRDTARGERVEAVTCRCDTVLKGTYIRCHSVWTNVDNKQTRELITFFNFNAKQNQYDILFLYDDWPGKVNYPLDYDPATRTLSGKDTFTAPGGIPAEERVSWEFSEDGNEIIGTEYNHYETDPPDFWPMSFKFTWRKVSLN